MDRSKNAGKSCQILTPSSSQITSFKKIIGQEKAARFSSHPSFLAVLNLHLFSLLTLLLFLRIMGSTSQAMYAIFQLSYCQTCSGCPAALGALPAPVANKPWISTAVLNTMILYHSQIRHGIGREGFEFEKAPLRKLVPIKPLLSSQTRVAGGDYEICS